MTQELLKILNPVRVLKVDDWIKAGRIKLGRFKTNVITDDTIRFSAFELISRYEALTSQPLKKEMFVCEVEKPRSTDFLGQPITSKREDILKYTKAQEKVWFEGFERNESIIIFSKSFEFYEDELIIPTTHNIRYYFIKNPTVSDFIYQVDLYNRTAKEPINISFTENFCKELLK